MPDNHVRLTIETGPGRASTLVVNKVCTSCQHVIKTKLLSVRVFDKSLHTTPKAKAWCSHCDNNVWLTAFWEG